MPASLEKRKPEDSKATPAKSEAKTSMNSKKSGDVDQKHQKKKCLKKEEKIAKMCEELELSTKLKDPKAARSKSLRGSSKGDSRQNKRSASLPMGGKEAAKDANKREKSVGQRMTAQMEKRKSSKKSKQKKKMAKQISNLVFVMPKTDDPVAKAQAASEKKVSKLVRYMKKYWKIHVDKKYYPVKIDYRMPDRMTHQRPNNWWLIKRARQKNLDHTGFFSNVREPYHDLGPPELDSSMLIFKNMHDDLLTDPTKWIQDRQIKDELIRKCNAPLVRLPRARVRRPVFNKGRVKIGAGGMVDINKYVQQGYAFQNAIRGDRTYTQTLDFYMEQKENDAADLASAFGFVPRKVPDAGAGDQKQHDHGAKAVKSTEQPAEEEREVLELHALQDDRKGSHLDDRINQRVLLSFESMMGAIYVLIRSMLNLKSSQLKSPYPLPMRVISSLRSTEPQDEKVKKKQPISSLSCKNVYKGTKSEDQSRTKSSDAEEEDEEEEEEEDEEDEDEYEEEEEDNENDNDEEKDGMQELVKDVLSNDDEEEEEEEDEEEEEEDEYIGETRSQMLLRKAKEERKLPIVNIRAPDRIASNIVATIKNTHLQKGDRGSISPEEKIKSFQESPDHALSRRKSNFEKYNKLFHGGEAEKSPIWQNITMDSFFTLQLKPNAPKSVHHFEGENGPDELTATTTPLPSTSKIPHMHEIHTPVLAGLESPVKIDSEDQSRLNLLAKNPEARNDNPPPSPVQFLYKVAGIKTTEKQTFDALMTIKKKFRVTEKSLRFYYANETDKADWETQNRFRHKIRALQSCPIYEKSIAIMRESVNFALSDEGTSSSLSLGEKRPSNWYRKLRETFEEIGASRHLGCATVMANLLKYCDVDMKTKPKMTNRLCLLVVSLPTTELGTRPWQLAIKFLTDHLLGVPVELFYQWLDYRRLPSLI